ncbi:uncharacterized protein LOC135172560 isoform X1 [Diachasmimorpha longicaudata]|uniref:uncharacterized protein LOC135172560 isoform X1 n=1 Tax=Diachasmimorpha longicaudata TaxID=58733 RepID=UPI0030B86C33
MIGPSATASGVSNREEDPVRVKRKLFEDLDIDSFCEEFQTTKKCHSMEVDGLGMSQVVHQSDFSTNSEHDTSGPVARLEVLVVDGTWDVSSLGGADLIDLSSSISGNAGVQGITDVGSIDGNYGTILYNWEPTVEDAGHLTQTCTSEQQTSSAGSSMSSSLPEDQENGNLSWLLDFKLDSLIEAPEDKPPAPQPRNNYTGSRNRNTGTNRVDTNASYATEIRGNYTENNPPGRQPQSTSYASDNRNFSTSRYGGPKKPPFTYTELIEHALQERGELTVSAIYQWISEHFPYYKSNDDRWKNSVRHNLSINPHFRKGSKAPHGAGHLWAIANRDGRPRALSTQQITSVPTQKQILKSIVESSYPRRSNNTVRQNVVIDEVAAATASICPSPEENVVGSVTLEHCAEQILSGIKRDVEVQYLMPMAVQNDAEDASQQIQQAEQNCGDKETERDCWNVLADFLNPVAKEVVAEECGLIGESYLVTDLNPAALGLNMAESEIITSDHLFGEELSFQFYELTSSSQLQSA